MFTFEDRLNCILGGEESKYQQHIQIEFEDSIAIKHINSSFKMLGDFQNGAWGSYGII